MPKITICFENTAGDIPTYEFTKEELTDPYFTVLEDQLKNREGSVIVCFQTWINATYEYEHQDILVTNNEESAIDYFNNFIESVVSSEINFNFFCFHTYEEAFKYCIDLKEGL